MLWREKINWIWEWERINGGSSSPPPPSPPNKYLYNRKIKQDQGWFFHNWLSKPNYKRKQFELILSKNLLVWCMDYFEKFNLTLCLVQARWVGIFYRGPMLILIIFLCNRWVKRKYIWIYQCKLIKHNW